MDFISGAAFILRQGSNEVIKIETNIKDQTVHADVIFIYFCCKGASVSLRRWPAERMRTIAHSSKKKKKGIYLKIKAETYQSIALIIRIF